MGGLRVLSLHNRHYETFQVEAEVLAIARGARKAIRGPTCRPSTRRGFAAAIGSSGIQFRTGLFHRNSHTVGGAARCAPVTAGDGRRTMDDSPVLGRLHPALN